MCSAGVASAACDEAQAKAKIYRFLAALFDSHPNEDSQRGVRRMAGELGVACPDQFSLRELDREYMDLFVVPGPRYVAPYESVFRDEWLLPPLLKRGSNPGETGRTIKGLVMGKSTLAVRQQYLEAGVVPEQDLPDHIANELRFMAYLWEREAEPRCDETRAWSEFRQRFRQDHLMQWIGQLHEKVAERDRLGYYDVALNLAHHVLREDTD